MPLDTTGTEVRYDGELGDSRPNDVALSADGALIYAAGDDGNLRVYSAELGEPGYDRCRNPPWRHRRFAGRQLIMAVEREPLAEHPAEGGGYSTYTVTAYRIDLATGTVTSFECETTSFDYAFHDVAVLANGDVLFTQSIFPGWSGWATMKVLDLDTGQYTVASQEVHTTPSSRRRKTDLTFSARNTTRQTRHC